MRRQRKQPRHRQSQTHDLRPQYDRLPPGAQLAADDVPDAIATTDPVRREGGEWIVEPARSTIIRSLKQDPVGRMHARGQVDEHQFVAARAYQRLVEASAMGQLRAAQIEGRTGSGYGSGRLGVTDVGLAAARRLRGIDGLVGREHGRHGLEILRAVVINKVSVESHANGQSRFFGMLLRRCLDEVAVATGLAMRQG
jgi:hypothetical protein